MSPVQGLHHVTAISGPARRNLGFYRDALGLRFVKKTVNFDDPGTYHLYYGDELGRPGTLVTFFAWDGVPRGTRGTGEVASAHLAVPAGSLDAWAARLPEYYATILRTETVHGEDRLVFADPDGMHVVLAAVSGDPRSAWSSPDVPADIAITGLAGITAVVRDARERDGIGRVLVEAFGYAQGATDRNVTRFTHPRAPAGAVVDVQVAADAAPAGMGGGSIHHIAFSVPDSAAQAEVRARLQSLGLQPTPPIDRDYFKAIYTRVPGGILFEVATDEPGFTVDEPAAELGTGLKLPRQHEHLRPVLAQRLADLGG